VLLGVSAPSADVIFVCGTDGMIFRSTDGGDVWTAASIPTRQTLHAISFYDENRGIAVGDSGLILYTSNGKPTSVDDRVGEVPRGFVLNQNYPNPFNPTTTIGYTVGVVSRQSSVVSGQWSVASWVRLAVYDLLGREVAVLVDGQKEPGSYEVRFDGSNLVSGVYLYRMQAGAFVQARKFLLVR
jgi:hypothetical protein